MSEQGSISDTAGDLNDRERELLKWLGEEEFNQYGECYGKTLDALIARGLAQVHQGQEYQGGFIARGDSKMYQAVSLTEAGRAAIAKAEGRT